MEEMAKKLKDARGETPRKDVCEALGISISALMMYENGKRVPRDTIKLKLAKYYGKSIEELFYFDQDGTERANNETIPA